MANDDGSVFVKHAACTAHISLLSPSLYLELRAISQQPNSGVSVPSGSGLLSALAGNAAGNWSCTGIAGELQWEQHSQGTARSWWSQSLFQPGKSWVLDWCTGTGGSSNFTFQCEHQKFLINKWEVGDAQKQKLWMWDLHPAIRNLGNPNSFCFYLVVFFSPALLKFRIIVHLRAWWPCVLLLPAVLLLFSFLLFVFQVKWMVWNGCLSPNPSSEGWGLIWFFSPWICDQEWSRRGLGCRTAAPSPAPH